MLLNCQLTDSGSELRMDPYFENERSMSTDDRMYAFARAVSFGSRSSTARQNTTTSSRGIVVRTL